MLDVVLEEAERLLREALGEEAEPGLQEPRGGYGDLASSVCFTLAKKLGKPPAAIAEEVVERIDLSSARFISRAEALNGFINFHFDYVQLARATLERVSAEGASYGRGRKSGRIILEHTSANPDGPLHIGHGRNAVIGDSLARILRFSGYEVETEYYLNDMGRQLAVVVLGLRRLKLDTSLKQDHAIARVYVEASRMVEESPELQAELSELMRAYEAGAEEVVREFREAAEYCMQGIRETLKRLGVEHELVVWESEFVRSGEVDKALERLRSSQYARQDEVLYLDLSSFGIEKELVLRRSDGTMLYATRDIAHHLWKAGRGRMINVWGADHKLLAQQMRAVMRILGAQEPEFVIHEFITLPEGSMSTRKGKFISMDELLDEAAARALQEVERRRSEKSGEFRRRVAEQVAVGAVRYAMVRVAPEKHVKFRWEEVLDFERQGAPFIQYAHARACRILEKAELPEGFEVGELTQEERTLVKLVASLPVVVERAAEELKPSLLAGYVLELATAFHSFYSSARVLGSEKQDFRLRLVDAVRTTLANGMRLLGIPVLEEM